VAIQREDEMAQEHVDDGPEPARPRRRWLRYLLVIAGLVAIIGIIGGIKFAQISSLIGMGKQMEAAGPPPEPVGSDVAQVREWENTLTAVGSIAGAESVSLSNDAPGIVTRLRFESGDMVKRGQVLVELDTSPERAQLAAASARRDNAQLTVNRSRALLAQAAIARAQLDVEETQLKSAAGDVAALRAQIARKVIRAPFSGRLGIRAVNVGQYLAPGTMVTVLDSVGGTFVDFALPQERLGEVRVGMPVRISTKGAPDAVEGTISAIEPTIDATSRNLKLRASATDPDGKLRPGMFVTVAVVLPERPKIVTLPVTSIVHAPYGDSVFVIENKAPGSPGLATTPDGKPVKVARQQFVKLGPSRGDYIAIADGVAAGQQVVSAGAFKLRNGSPVVIDNSIKPAAQLEPRPENR
jgi:membrane fusion protein, multidrug efflux system